MNYTKNRLLVLLISSATMAIQPASARGQESVIGTSAAFSGPSRGLGIELYRGSKAYFEQVNSQGGVHGHKIVIKAYDDGYNTPPAIDQTFRLIDADRVVL